MRLPLLVLLVIGISLTSMAAIVVSPAVVSGAETPQLQHDTTVPVQITAEQLDADDQAGIFVFTGNVQAQQDDAFIYARKMTVYYLQGEKKQLDKVIAENDVRIVQLDRVATGQKAVFYHQDGRIVLTGQPRVVQAGNTVEGERIVVYLNDNRSIVEGSPNKRVKVVFIPEDK